MKMYTIKGLAIGFCAMLCIQQAEAKEVIGVPNNGRQNNDLLQRKAAQCLPATAQVDIDVNNVRARILNGGDMWWDLNSVAKYEIPKINDANGIRKNSMFAGAIWVGGVDVGGNLKVAAMTYRQSGSDYFPGALDTTSGEIDKARCTDYDKIWKVNRSEIEKAYKEPTTATIDIIEWPGNGVKPVALNEPKILAPFYDEFGDGIYNYEDGDYPILDPTRPADKNKPEDQPDQMLYFVYNDKGNIHSETGGIPIGIELQTIAFAFATNDEVNNMTFYKTKITNRSFDEIRNCYFGQWVDADLGNYSDDYVGVDISRKLGFCYNGDDDDEGILGYGLNPPSVGTTFFEGPRDSAGNEIGLTKFVYYNNDFSVTGNPQAAEHYYGYLRGIWKDGSPITEGGNGHLTGAPASYMFPGDPNVPGEWHEKSAGNTPGDRRYLQSAGPFNLKPGAVNYVTVGVVWARTTTGGATGSLNLLRLASDKAQKLFNNKFQILDGPPAPTLEIQELDQELIITMVDSTRTLKDIESFRVEAKGAQNTLHYEFQGYKIYQLRDGSVTTGQLDNVEQARLLFQLDKKDQYGRIVNQELDPDLGVNIPTIKVNGANEGLRHSFRVTEDLFATGNSRLVNFQSYHYVILAYSVCVDDPNEPIQYLEGRLNVTSYRGIPHKNDPREGGTKLQAGYASGPQIIRHSGSGNGGVFLELSSETIEEVLRAPYISDAPKYLGGAGPVDIKVIDPIKVPNANFELIIFDTSLTTTGARRDSLHDEYTFWKLTNLDNGEIIYSDTNIHVPFEQVIAKWGLSVTVGQAVAPGWPENELDDANGFIGFEIIWEDDARQWLSALDDIDNSLMWLNWIRSGTNGRTSSPAPFNDQNYTHDFAIGGEPLDPFERYENIWDGRIAPYALASRASYQNTSQATYGPAFASSGVGNDNKLSDLQSVDIVLTPDRSKWTRAIVVEMSEDKALSTGNIEKHRPRASLSLEKDLKTTIAGDFGRSWFPGYAINLETGERLNIMFGEDSYLADANGNDMIWNPTDEYGTALAPIIGGKHHVYIMGRKSFAGYNGTKYDEGNSYMDLFATNKDVDIRKVYSQCLWVMPALSAPGFQMKDGVPPTEVTIKLRVKRSYGTERTDLSNPGSAHEQPRFTFNTGDIAPQQSTDAGKDAMALINIVPNPYYAYSAYEGSQLDNRVKLINLPTKCTISIFTLNGALVKQIKKDDESTFVDWDLKNHANVPIASGMYIIHVDGGDLGEKVIKWFGVMRQIDLDSF